MFVGKSKEVKSGEVKERHVKEIQQFEARILSPMKEYRTWGASFVQ